MSPYTFVVCAEVLAEAFCNNDDIKCIEIFGEEHVISQFADDTTLFLVYSLQDVRNCLKTIEDFKHFSGLKMNLEKSHLIELGGIRASKMKIDSDLQRFAKYCTQELLQMNISTK